MTSRITHLGVVEPSHIVFEGINALLARMGQPYALHRFEGLADAHQSMRIDTIAALLVNPACIALCAKDFHIIKRNHPALPLIGIIYAFHSPELLKLLDGLIHITDGIDQMARALQRLLAPPSECDADGCTVLLSDREREVLVELVSGLSNKEIADRLCISIHTVVTHRKNIAQKTGIRSQAGLTIYAITNRIVSLDGVV